MYYITTDTATQDHEFTDGDELQSIPPTDLNALWFNTIQRELINVLSKLGITPNVSNFEQIWDCLKTIGFRAIYSEGDVVTTNFDGSVVIFHSASSFNIDNLKTRSLIVVVPMWTDESPSYIVVRYGSQNHQIKKGFFFVGMAANGAVQDLSLFGIDIPRAFNGNDLNVGVLTAFKVKSSKRFESNLVSFGISAEDVDPETGLSDWIAWQLFENWEIGQVKRVYCTNVDTVADVPIYYDESSFSKNVQFFKNGYREFVCIGSRSVTISGTARIFAILLVNGFNRT